MSSRKSFATESSRRRAKEKWSKSESREREKSGKCNNLWPIEGKQDLTRSQQTKAVKPRAALDRIGENENIYELDERSSERGKHTKISFKNSSTSSSFSAAVGVARDYDS